MLLADMAQVLEFLKDSTISAVTKIFLFLSMSIYNLITMMYAIFKTIAEARFVTADTIKDLTSRLYLLIGIIALFLVAYSFLMVIVNPENITKGKFATAKMVRNIILSVVTITFVPTIFNFSYAVQKSILEKDVIAKIILDRGSGNIDTGEDRLGDFSISIFESSFYLRDMSETADPDAVAQYDSCAAQAKLYGDIRFFSACSDLIADGKAEFNPILSIIVGLFAVYVLGLYCMDMGLRTVKLVLLQIIAPIPCLLMIIPDQEKVFKSWLKNVVKTFMEVFLKIFILTLGVYMIQLVANIMHNYGAEAFGPMFKVVGIWVNLFIILGILMFINQAPKLISEIFGIDLGHGLSLKKRLDDVKAGWKTATAPVRAAAGGLNKAIGAGMGVYFANKARKKAEAQEGHPGTSRTKKAISNVMGFRNGWRGGISGSGSAYTYEQLMQQSYALDSAKSEKDQIKSAIFDRARGLVGRDSRYDEETRNQAVLRDRKNALLKKQMQEIEATTGSKIRQIDKDHEATMEANKAVSDAGSAIVDAVKNETGKVDSNIRVSMKDIYSGYETKLQDKINDVTTNATERARLQAELDNLHDVKEHTNFIANSVDAPELDENGNIRRGAYGAPIMKKADGEFISDSFNRAGMQAKIEYIQKLSDSEMSQETKNAIISMLHHGEDMANEAYIKDKDNWSTDVKVAVSNARTVVKDVDAGFTSQDTGNVKTVILKDDNGNILKKSDGSDMTIEIPIYEKGKNKDYDFENLIARADKGELDLLLKLGKEAKKLVNAETETKNNRLTTEKVTVLLTGEDGIQHEDRRTLYEWQGDTKRRDKQIKDNNQEYERFVESHVTEKEVNETKKRARDAAPKAPRQGNGH